MILKIEHASEYIYSNEVYLDPHTLRLTPRFSPSQRIIEEGVSIYPKPMGQSRCLSPEGCIQDFVWFNGVTDKLRVESSIVVSLTQSNPYDFLIYPNEGQILPLKYPAELAHVLAPALTPLSGAKKIEDVAHALAQYSDYKTIPFLSNLMAEVSMAFNYSHRAEGEPKQPEETFRDKEGSCRDLVVFTLAVLRKVGIASRFVSGYYIQGEEFMEPELHAWVEVYLPGGGWRGFDPTCGVACYGRHIALSASYDPKLTMPIEGAFRGNAESLFQFNLSTEIVEASNWYIHA